uniref:C2H2-type domain-containing protein n=1 Tax=Lotharella oceanica TaxID=641309 RepID=A0A7S2U2Q1_9EUKA
MWVLLVLLGARADHGDSGDCHRGNSRRVRSILEEHVWPKVKSVGYVLPEGCGLNGESDVFLAQEKKKKRVRNRLWTCLECKKKFKSEKWLDLHLDRKHKHLLRNTSSVCLGDLCEIFDCESISQDSSWRPSTCNEADVEHERIHCNNIAHTCFPPDQGRTAYRLHDEFIEEICNNVRCDHQGTRVKLFDRNHYTGLTVMYWILFAVCLAGLAVFYTVYYMTFGDTSLPRDLRKRRGYSRWWSWCGKSKSKIA